MDELTDTSVDEVLHLAPFGLGNRSPLFLLRGAEVRQAPELFGKDREHIRLRLFQGTSCLFAKAWRFASRAGALQPGTKVDVAMTLEADAFSAKRGYAPWGATIREIRLAE